MKIYVKFASWLQNTALFPGYLGSHPFFWQQGHDRVDCPPAPHRAARRYEMETSWVKAQFLSFARFMHVFPVLIYIRLASSLPRATFFPSEYLGSHLFFWQQARDGVNYPLAPSRLRTAKADGNIVLKCPVSEIFPASLEYISAVQQSTPLTSRWYQMVEHWLTGFSHVAYACFPFQDASFCESIFKRKLAPKNSSFFGCLGFCISSNPCACFPF